jgi:hypothetical protein
MLRHHHHQSAPSCKSFIFPNLRARDRCRPDEFAAVLKAQEIMLKKSLHAAERDRSDRAHARRAFTCRQPRR